jgi:multiple sugar transport system substrate-binding protein
MGIGNRTVRRRQVLKAALVLPWMAGAAVAARPAPSRGQGKKTLQFASWQWLEPGGKEAWEQLSADFAASQTGATIKEVAIPFPRYQDTLLVQLTGGQAPDVLLANIFMFLDFQARGLLQPLDSVLPVSKYQSDMLPSSRAGVVGGQTYGIMVQWNPYALLYNDKLLKAAGLAVPKSTTEFFNTASKLTKAQTMFGYGTRSTLAEEAGWWYEMSYWVYAFGGRWAVNGRPTANSPEVLQGIRFFKALYDSNVFPKVDAATYRQMFAAEKVAMITDVPVLVSITKKQNPAINIGVAPNPFAPNPPATLGANVFLAIPKGSPDAKTAAVWIDWVYQHQATLGQVYGITGSKRSNVEVFGKVPYLQTYASMPVVQGGGLVPPGFGAVFGDFRHIALQHVAEVLAENRDVTQAMNAAQQELETLATRVKPK